jgi:uncharacterized membrane protein YphA (DoxX/SURF4 family)
VTRAEEFEQLRALNVTSRLRVAGCLPFESVDEKETDHKDVSRPLWRGGCGMSIALCVVQVLLAATFLVSGATKLSQRKEKLLKYMAWVEDFSQGAVRIIGALEVLGAIGIVLPALTGILPWLTPLAALGLMLTMIGAALTHLGRAEYGPIAVTAVLLVLAAFVVYGRFFVLPA